MQPKATFNELLNHALKMATDQRNSTPISDAARDLSIAITHIEDALTRYNSAQYRESGNWVRLDPDRFGG